MLEAAFVAGVASEGVDVAAASAWCRRRRWPGCRPTPTIARRRDLGVAQPLRRQRHQAVRRRRPQARPTTPRPPSRRRSHAAPAGPRPTGAGVGVVSRRRTADASTAGPTPSSPRSRAAGSTACGSWSTAPTGRPRPWAARVLERLGADVVLDRTPRPTAPTSTTAAARPTPTPSPPRSVGAGADLGLALDGDADRCLAVDAAGARRRRRPDPRRARRSTAGERPACPHDTVVVTVMTNLGFRQAMAEQGITRRRHRRRRPHVLDALEAGRLRPRRRAVGPRHPARPGHDRRRAPHRRPPADVVARTRPAARRPRRGDDPAAAGAAQRAAGRAPSPDLARPRRRRRRRRRGRARRPAAGCCCGRAAPSRSCG